MVNAVICHCKKITYAQIRQAVLDGAETFDEVADILGCGTLCGACYGRIQDIIDSL